jgi:glycerol-3-phosphate dehydrogenase
VIERSELLERLRNMEAHMLVVGGGITGACIARDAAMRGIRVALVERRDFAWGTSSRSSKLVHGGLRYLEQLDFRLVFEATRERAVLGRIAPHLVFPIPFLFPIYDSDKNGVLKIGAGMWLYDLLASFRQYRWHRMMGSAETSRAEPGLQRDGLAGAACYYDSGTHDARLTIVNVVDAVRHGGVCLNGVSYEGVERSGGRIAGARLRDEESGERFSVKCDLVVHAAGPFTDEVQAAAGLTDKHLVRPTKGTHLIVPAERLPVSHAVVMTTRSDGRVTFAIPWGEGTLIGTTDTDYAGDKSNVHASSDDVDYLLDAVRTYFPSSELCRDDVISTYAGLRPLVRQDKTSPYEVTREHEIHWDPAGIMTICGGKLTTCRKMAEELVDRFLRERDEFRASARVCSTAQAPLPGGGGISGPEGLAGLARGIQERTGLDDASSEHLARAYGSETYALLDGDLAGDGKLDPLVPGLPYLAGEVDVAVNQELARSTSDVLQRRLHVFYKDADQGLGVCEQVASRVAELMGKDAEWRQADAEAYRTEVARSRAWRAEVGDA